MSPFYLGLLFGVFLGAWFGFFAACLMTVLSEDRRREIRAERGK